MSMPAACGWRTWRDCGGEDFCFGGLPLRRDAIQCLWLRVDGGRAARSVEEASEQSPERDEVRRVNVGLLTSDLHGGCGPKLTHGFCVNTIGRPGYGADRPPPPTKNKTHPNTSDARCLKRFLRHCSSSNEVGSLTRRCSEQPIRPSFYADG